LGVESGIPLLQGEFERRLKEVRQFRPGVADEDIEPTELSSGGRHDALHLVGVGHVALDQGCFRTGPLDELNRLLGLFLVRPVVHRDRDPFFRKFQGYAPPDAASTSGDQRTGNGEPHGVLLSSAPDRSLRRARTAPKRMAGCCF